MTNADRRETCREVLGALLARRGCIVLDISAYRWLRSAGFAIRDVDRAVEDLTAAGRAALEDGVLVARPTERSAAA